MKKLHLISLGCVKNLIDSEVMLGKLKDYKLWDDVSKSDLIIVNTCGFIQSAKEESLNKIFEVNKLRKQDSILVMSGCLAQRYKDYLQDELVEVDIFTGVGDYDIIDTLVEEKQSKFSNKVFLADKNNQRVISGSNYHAYIKLSEGCNQQCSFCAIPNFKGKLQSRDLDSIKDEIEKLISKGYYDFTFVSQDSSSYLRDKKIYDGLEQLIDMVEVIQGIKSARILYLYPSTTTINLIQKIGNSKIFYSYFDMPIQHICNNILKDMKRGVGTKTIKKLLKNMKKIDNSFIRTSLIVGYPDESKDDFKKLKKFVKKFKFDRVNVFSYSDEEETLAFKSIKKIPQKIIDKRANKLGDIVRKQTIKSLKKMIGKTYEVVVEKYSNEHQYLLSARALDWGFEIDGEIYINDKKIQTIEFGKKYIAKITDIIGDKLLGTIEK